MIKGNSFRIKMLFFLVALIGVFLLPYISVQLNPPPRSFTLNINFNFPKANAAFVESQATSRLEQAFARLNHLVELSSTSREGGATIQLKFDKNIAIEQKRLEVATLIRQIYPFFDRKISFPEISYKSQFQEEQNLLVYSLVSDLPSEKIEDFVNRELIPPLSTISGIKRIELVGTQKKEWQITINEHALQQLGLSYAQITEKLKENFEKKDIGWLKIGSNQKVYLQFGQVRGHKSVKQLLDNTLLLFKENRPIYLKDVATIKYNKQLVNSYFRINGQGGANLIFFSDKSVNQLQLANTLKKNIASLQANLPDKVQLFLQYDASQFLSKELLKIGYRILGATLLLFLFVLILYPRPFISILFQGLALSLLGSILVYYAFGITLHLYSIAGLTLSLGIILDNIIIMADHLRKKSNKKIIIALVAANLTTIGAFLVVFQIDAAYREELTDFIAVFAINLLMSLVVAIWFIPTLIYKKEPTIHLPKFKRKPFILRFNRLYKRYILLFQKKKWLVYLILIISFGLPFILLPKEIEKEDWYAAYYNQIFSSDIYKEEIHPFLNKYLGCLLYTSPSPRDATLSRMPSSA